MATDRLPAQVIADDSLSTWRFEKPAGTLAFAAASSRLAAPNLVAVRADAASDCMISLATGGETGTTLDFYWKLDGATDKLTLFTASGATVYTVTAAGVMAVTGQPTILTASLTWDPGSIVSLDTATTTVTVTGASTANSAVLVTPNAALLENIFVDGFVSAANTVTVRMSNQDSGSQNETSHIYRIVVFQY